MIIENSIHVTGALNSVLRTSEVLKVDYNFIFVLPVGSKASVFIRDKGFDVYEIPMLELSKRWQSVMFYIPFLIRSVYLVKKIVRDRKIAIVHVNDFYNLIMPLWWLFGGSVRYLCYVNFVPDRFPFLLRKLWVNSHMIFSSKIVTVSEHVLKQLPESAKVTCIPCALPDEQTVSSTRPEKRKVLLFLGNFIEGKGQDFAIRAFSLIAKSHSDWSLRFVGGDMGMEKNRLYQIFLRSLAQELEVEKQIEWSNFSEDVINEYQLSAIALNFSKSESYSLTVQEAMFYGCAVIATRSGGPAELIEHNFSGLLVPVDNIVAMSNSMNYLIENPDERLRLKNNALISVRKKYHKTNTIDKLNFVYHNILQVNSDRNVR